MGSKRKSAQMIYQTIKNHNPNATKIVDLFCGGFAISEIFLKNGFEVIANDKNNYVVELIREAIKGRFNDSVFEIEFITRSKFTDVLKNTDKYDEWFVGYVMCIWSFGNNQKGYLFGKETEPIKKAGHELVINKNPKLILELFPKFPQKYIDGILKQSDWHKSRIALQKVSKTLQNRKFELQRLQQLEQLERLQQLEQLERLELYSKSYNEIEIPKDAIIYCDPPYAGTAEYKEGSFNHKEFFEWIREISKTNKVYISEYTAPSDFNSILSFEQKSTLQGGQQKHNNQPMERLFTI